MKISLIPSFPVVQRLMFVLVLCLSARVAVCQSPPAAESDSPEATTQTIDVANDEPITSGKALMLKLQQGGITILFLLVVSVMALASALERMINLRLGRVVPRQAAERMEALCREGKFKELEAAASTSNSTLGRVVTAMVRHRGMNSEAMTTLAGDVSARELKLHLLRAYPLMVCATISPLLGLFGTVAGMIGAFDKVAAAGSLGDASMLGGDISKALITTAAGLVVAIPALSFYHFFRSRTNLMVIVLEERISELLSLWYKDNGQNSEKKGRDE